MNTLHRCFENGESVKSVSEEIGYSRANIYAWRKRYHQGGAASLMNEKNIKPDTLPDINEKVSSEDMEALRKQMYEPQMGVDILKETISVLKGPRRRLEEPEKQGEGGGNRRHEGKVAATQLAPEDGAAEE